MSKHQSGEWSSGYLNKRVKWMRHVISFCYSSVHTTAEDNIKESGIVKGKWFASTHYKDKKNLLI